MDIQLKRLRKISGFKTQKDIADALGIPERRYSSWERGEVMMSLEQAYYVTELLGCTLDELVGRKPPKTPSSFVEYELISCFRDSTDERKSSILQTARDAAGMSKDAAERAASEPV